MDRTSRSGNKLLPSFTVKIYLGNWHIIELELGPNPPINCHLLLSGFLFILQKNIFLQRFIDLNSDQEYDRSLKIILLLHSDATTAGCCHSWVLPQLGVFWLNILTFNAYTFLGRWSYLCKNVAFDVSCKISTTIWLYYQRCKTSGQCDSTALS